MLCYPCYDFETGGGGKEFAALPGKMGERGLHGSSSGKTLKMIFTEPL
jgi:hypothetical protein